VQQVDSKDFYNVELTAMELKSPKKTVIEVKHLEVPEQKPAYKMHRQAKSHDFVDPRVMNGLNNKSKLVESFHSKNCSADFPDYMLQRYQLENYKNLVKKANIKRNYVCKEDIRYHALDENTLIETEQVQINSIQTLDQVGNDQSSTNEVDADIEDPMNVNNVDSMNVNTDPMNVNTVDSMNANTVDSMNANTVDSIIAHNADPMTEDLTNDESAVSESCNMTVVMPEGEVSKFYPGNTKFKIKAKFEDVLVAFIYDEKVDTFLKLQAKLQQKLNVFRKMAIFYLDEDGDKIRMISEDDYVLALSLLYEGNLKLFVE
jgi:hypothetical protein